MLSAYCIFVVLTWSREGWLPWEEEAGPEPRVGPEAELCRGAGPPPACPGGWAGSHLPAAAAASFPDHTEKEGGRGREKRRGRLERLALGRWGTIQIASPLHRASQLSLYLKEAISGPLRGCTVHISKPLSTGGYTLYIMKQKSLAVVFSAGYRYLLV